jgi:pectate lyase
MSFQGDTLAATGGDRVYVFRVPANLAQPAIVQDDFADANSAGWIQSSPTWTVPVAYGSRVFRQTSTTNARFATLSQINWSNVAIEADVRPLAFNGSDRWVGLLARHVDSQHYYYVSLRNNTHPASGAS